MSDSISFADYLLGFLVGSSTGFVLGLPSNTEIKNYQKPKAIIYEDFNKDGLEDIVIKQKKDGEIKLQAYKTQKGNIRYKLLEVEDE
ncbi:hypothetical protein ACFLZZ_01275 [Nanoarchaeota archaeon]